MEKFAKSKMITLICAILIVVIATGFFVPYTIAYFTKKHQLGGENQTPNIVCEMVSTGFKNGVTINNTQMFVAENSFSGTNANGTSASVNINSNIDVLVRVKLTFKLASGNSNVTQNELTSVNNNFTANVNAQNWLLATSDEDGSGSAKAINTTGGTNAAYLTTYYLYYKQIVKSANGEQNLLVFNDFKQIDATYNGKFLVAELYCEAVQANSLGANKWAVDSNNSIPLWASDWITGLGELKN